MSESDVNRLFHLVESLSEDLAEQGRTLAGIMAVAKAAAWTVGLIGIGGIAMLLRMAGVH